MISKLTCEHDTVYSCFYGLASAFDTITYPILLDHLYSAGISWKLGTLSRAGIQTLSLMFRWVVQLLHPSEFTVVCVKAQFSPPILFLPMMDPVLLSLKFKSCGINICGLYSCTISCRSITFIPPLLASKTTKLKLLMLMSSQHWEDLFLMLRSENQLVVNYVPCVNFNSVAVPQPTCKPLYQTSAGIFLHIIFLFTKWLHVQSRTVD